MGPTVRGAGPTSAVVGQWRPGHQEHLAGLAGEEVDGFLVFPECVLSYLGQGALVLDDPASNISSPFFLLVPQWGRLPMALLATAATVITSQAVITGAFSVASQAAQLGYFYIVWRHWGTPLWLVVAGAPCCS